MEHAANTSIMTMEVFDSAKVCKSTTENVDKLIADTIEFMEDYKTTYNSNTVTANKAIHNIGAMFKAERMNFVDLWKEFQSDNQAFQSSINAEISKLQEELAMERKIMDALTIKDEKSPVNPPIIKKETKCKEKLINNEPIINDEGDEGPDEAELKRRKAREAELDENARIVREAE
ncbi:unnamed protein product [Lactuca saligna]|uniref:Uncharacterized protein n=1 Tax=Lactuca saligna TaxID=75948 RepID=A0AA35VME3_LACSI|nr:unnamed protein product [Lactuca saligna]